MWRVCARDARGEQAKASVSTYGHQLPAPRRPIIIEITRYRSSNFITATLDIILAVYLAEILEEDILSQSRNAILLQERYTFKSKITFENRYIEIENYFTIGIKYA